MSSDPFGLAADGEGGKDVAIRVRDVSKHYVMFERPEDRLKQMVVPRLERLIGRSPRRYFADFAALNGVSFEVGRGETVGIIGRNGSGKSTLLQIVCGTLQPTSGTVEVNGRIAALLELGAGFNPEFTGRENVFLNASILGVPRKEMEWRFDDIVRFADIGAFINQPVKTYSSGMYVRLAFAVAINVDPDILVVDEALSVGDEAFQRKCYARIENIREKGGTILFVSHGAQTIVQLCNRAMLFDRGELLMAGRPKTVVAQYQRLVNLNAEDAVAVREEIRARDGWAEPPVTKVPDGESEVGRPANAADPNDVSSFDIDLASASAVEYESHGALIQDVRITATDGRRVNVLKFGRRYAVEYSVVASQDADHIICGMQIKTVSGFVLAGANNEGTLHRIRRLRRGQVLRVRFEFNCLPLPGTYLIDTGVMGERDGQQLFLHRVLDVSMFRVAPEQGLVDTGLIGLSATFSYSDAAEFESNGAEPPHAEHVGMING